MPWNATSIPFLVMTERPVTPSVLAVNSTISFASLADVGPIVYEGYVTNPPAYKQLAEFLQWIFPPTERLNVYSGLTGLTLPTVPTQAHLLASYTTGEADS
jgi:hypothetical protein